MVKKLLLILLVLSGLMFSQIAEQCFADASAQLQQARWYRKSGYYEPAREIYQSIVQNYPGTDYALQAQGGLICASKIQFLKTSILTT